MRDDRPPEAVALDAAVMKHFRGVECYTRFSEMAGKLRTTFWPVSQPARRVPKPLSDKVNAFIAGYHSAIPTKETQS